MTTAEAVKRFLDHLVQSGNLLLRWKGHRIVDFVIIPHFKADGAATGEVHVEIDDLPDDDPPEK